MTPSNLRAAPIPIAADLRLRFDALQHLVYTQHVDEAHFVLVRSYVGLVPLMAVFWSGSHLGERTLSAFFYAAARIFGCAIATLMPFSFPQDVFVEAIEVGGWVGGCTHG